MAVPVTAADRFEPGEPSRLFDARPLEVNGRVDFEVSRDGQRFLINEQADGGDVLNVITDWRGLIEPCKRPGGAA